MYTFVYVKCLPDLVNDIICHDDACTGTSPETSAPCPHICNAPSWPSWAKTEI